MSSAPEEPYINLDLAGTEFRATPRNAQLFTFAGYATLENGDFILNPESRNHVFLETHEPEGDVMRGTYIFLPDAVAKMMPYMIETGFPCRINQRYIQDCDEAAYQTYCDQNAEYFGEQLEDEIPDWMEDGNA